MLVFAIHQQESTTGSPASFPTWPPERSEDVSLGSDSPQTSNSPIITFLYIRTGPARTAECSLGHSCSWGHHVLQSVDSISWKCACYEVHGHRLSRNSCIFQQFLLLNGPDCEGRNVFEGGEKGVGICQYPGGGDFFFLIIFMVHKEEKRCPEQIAP